MRGYSDPDKSQEANKSELISDSDYEKIPTDQPAKASQHHKRWHFTSSDKWSENRKQVDIRGLTSWGFILISESARNLGRKPWQLDTRDKLIRYLRVFIVD